VTHDPEEAMRIADRIVLMRAGRIVQTGTPEELYRSPVDLEAARFFCDLNEIACQIRNGEAETPIGRFPAKGAPEGAGALCLRPQAFRLNAAGEGVPARIRSARFLGEMHFLELDVQGLDQPVRARVRERPPSNRKRDVGLTIDFDEALVFGHQRA
jgi:iron(III) transport system ATP-binding protein